MSENLQRKAPPNEGKQLIHGRTGFIGLRVLGHVFGNGGERFEGADQESSLAIGLFLSKGGYSPKP